MKYLILCATKGTFSVMLPTQFNSHDEALAKAKSFAENPSNSSYAFFVVPLATKVVGTVQVSIERME